MKYIYATEEAITVGETPPDNCLLERRYSKQRLIQTIQEFPELMHPLPVYTFQAPTGELHETLDISAFARLHGLNETQLHSLIYKFDWRNHKGWKFVRDIPLTS